MPAAGAVTAESPAEPEELEVLGAATDDTVPALPVEEATCEVLLGALL